jgi:hypothetical protein
MTASHVSDNLAFHAARLLLLTAIVGRPQGEKGRPPAIEGRTLLAKLDFFLRYPHYLLRAAEIVGVALSPHDAGLAADDDAGSVESQMVRYLYGPWDHVYYPTLAYAIGKQLIVVEKKKSTDVFRLTPLGLEVAERLLLEKSYAPLGRRARIIRKLFSRYSGNGLRKFIYEHFPDVVSRRIGESI